MAFEKWQDEAARLKRERYMITGAINRLLKWNLSQGFEKWQAEAARMKRQKYLMAGAIRRMLNRDLSMAFEKWQAETARLKRAAYLAGGAVRRPSTQSDCRQRGEHLYAGIPACGCLSR